MKCLVWQYLSYHTIPRAFYISQHTILIPPKNRPEKGLWYGSESIWCVRIDICVHLFQKYMAHLPWNHFSYIFVPKVTMLILLQGSTSNLTLSTFDMMVNWLFSKTKPTPCRLGLGTLKTVKCILMTGMQWSSLWQLCLQSDRWLSMIPYGPYLIRYWRKAQYHIGQAWLGARGCSMTAEGT